jgi:hypothetical protein
MLVKEGGGMGDLYRIQVGKLLGKQPFERLRSDRRIIQK